MLCVLFSACSKGNSSNNKNNIVPPPPKDTVKQYQTPYAGVPDTKDVMMYEVNFAAFSQQQNIAGVTARLDSLKALGINVIWLMPTYPIGKLKSFGSPYCVQNYLQVNPGYGTLTSLRALVSAAHSKGISVILDWVGNHTSWDNPWITEHKDWYQQDASGNIISPPNTNYSDVAALNYSNSSMRQAMISAMKYWMLEANIDGYRCDFSDNIPDDFWSQAIDTLKTLNHKLVLLAEGSKTTHFASGFQMIYGWNYFSALETVFSSQMANASTLYAIDRADKTSVPSGDFMLRFTSNHDEESDGNDALTVFKGKAGSMAAFTLTACEGGVPLVYTGQEVGAPKTDFGSTTIPVDWTANPDMLAAYKKILAFRNSSEAIKTGTLTSTYIGPGIVMFEKTASTDTVLVIANINTVGEGIAFLLPASLNNTTWKDAMNNNHVVTLNGEVSLVDYQYMILRK